jgi:hypothetical protein
VSQFNPLFPASYRPQTDPELPYQPSGEPRFEFIQHELEVERLNKIHQWLWLVGRPMPPRPLHYQKSISREIVIVELMDMHLVWSDKMIYLKPIPRYLLDYDFWRDNLLCKQGSYASTGQEGQGLGSGNGSQKQAANTKHSVPNHSHTQGDLCQQQKLYECAIGFLLSYIALIQYESDFYIAKSANLLPGNVTWIQWVDFVKQLLEARKHVKVNRRFLYGELRLHRLNWIYRFRLGQYRGYRNWYRQGTIYFRENLTPIISFIVYISVVLTAMQVGLATDRLKANVSFQQASYGFTVFSILAPLGFVGLVVLLFFLFLLDDLIKTLSFEKKRLAELGQQRPGDSKT